MKNTFRKSDFIKIKHMISGCEKLHQLESLKQIIHFYNQYESDGAELRALYDEKEKELNLDIFDDENSIESFLHKKLSV